MSSLHQLESKPEALLMKRLTILITNARLAKRTGAELYAFELAEELLRRGHRPIVFAPHTGPLARELRKRTIPVASRLEQIGAVPDIIHGHHALPTICTSLRFPTAPVVFVCHGWSSELDSAPKLATIRRYVAVDQTCYDRLVCESGIPDGSAEVIYNFVNLHRFRQRNPLPAKPQRALLFTNRGRFSRLAPILRKACRGRGIQLDLLGSIGGRQSNSPESVLGKYDLVFARAKAAMEAMAVGAAVVLCDRGGLGPLVAPQNFDRLRKLNFGRRSLTAAVTAENVAAVIENYSPSDAATVSSKIRDVAPLTLAADQLLELYYRVIDESAAGDMEAANSLSDAADYLESVAPIIDRGARAGRWKQAARMLWRFPPRATSQKSRAA